MSRLDDYRNRTTLTRFSDEDLEVLISGGPSPDPELTDLALLLAEMREHNMTEPAPDEVERMARRAAALASSQSVAARIAPPTTHRRSPLKALRAYSSVAVAILALVTFSGLGLAANAAVPGDFLYGLDLAMEKVGIGAGDLQERVSEAEALAESGDYEAAIDHLATSIADADDTAPDSLAEALDSLDEYAAILEVKSQDQGNAANDNAGGNSGNSGNENAGPGNNNAGGNNDNETPVNENTGPGNNNAGGNSDNNSGNSGGGNNGNENSGPGNNNAGGNKGGN